MKKRVRSLTRIFFLFGAVIACCIATVIGAKPMPAAVRVAGEKIYLFSPIDSSTLNSLEGWPEDSFSQNLLNNNFKTMYHNLYGELKRSEKLGLYEMVEDSLQATTKIKLVMLRYSLAHDTLLLPVQMSMAQGSVTKVVSKAIAACGIYRAHSKPKSKFHYIDLLLADYCRSFPYKKVVGFFCPTMKVY